MNEATATNSPGLLTQILLVVTAYVSAEIVLIAFAYLWVLIYSILIYSGGDDAYYETYAQVSSPVVAVLFAGPMFYAIARLMNYWWPDQALKLAMLAASINILVGLLIVMSVEMESLIYQVGAMALATTAMFIGAYFGTRVTAKA